MAESSYWIFRISSIMGHGNKILSKNRANSIETQKERSTRKSAGYNSIWKRGLEEVRKFKAKIA